ncbi:hypothetical protein QQ045_017467 [Rhodiola kirilowii]
MDWGFVSKAWDKWASISVGSSGQPLKAAFLINYEANGPSRLLPIIAEQEGHKVTPLDLSQFVEFVKHKQFQSDTFYIAGNEYLVTSIHESWFSARSMNSTNPAGEGAIVMQTAAFLLIGVYEGSVDSASRAMFAVDQFAWQIGRRNL